MDTITQAKKVFSRLGFCYLAGTVFLHVLRIAAGNLLAASFPNLLSNLNANMILSCIMVYGLTMPLTLLLVSRMEKTELPRRPIKGGQFVIAVMICYALVYASNLIGTMLTTAIGMLKGSAVQNDLIEVATGGNTFLNFVIMVVIVPIVEEYVFRKTIVDRTVRYGEGIAMITSGLMFGLYHGNLNQFAYAVVLGCFFAFLYMKTGNLKITIAIHAIINFLGGIVSGQLLKKLDYATLIHLSPDKMIAFFEDHLGILLVFGIYALFIIGIAIAGIVLFIVSLAQKRFTLAPGALPKGSVCSALLLNPGMLAFTLVWIVLIVIQLLS